MMHSAIIFDFDGVILESADLKTRTFVRLFESFQQHETIKDYLTQNSGLSRYEKFRHIYREFLGQEISEAEMQRLDSQFSELISDQIRCCPFVPGVIEFLQKRVREFPLFIVSATPEQELVSIVQDRNLTGFFTGIYGAPHSKSSLLRLIQQKTGMPADSLVFIGDSFHDYRAAAEVGISFIGRTRDGEESPFAGLPVTAIRDFEHLDGIWTS